MFSTIVAKMLPWLPRALVGKVARRYIAGESIADARATCAPLIESGLGVTVDLVGEDITCSQEADAIVDEYMKLLESLPTWPGATEQAGISLKPSQFGLTLDAVEGAARVTTVVKVAAERGIFVRLDMEGSDTTDAILELYRELHARYPGAIGVALQAMLFRTRNDVRALHSAPDHDIRLCKGIYRESDDRAWHAYRGIRDNYLTLAESGLQHGVKVRMATHDGWLITRLLDLQKRLGIDPAQIEFQALLGVPIRKTIARLRDLGHPVRLYVPYGTAWYPYSVRRLRENPAVAGHVLKGLLSRQR